MPTGAPPSARAISAEVDIRAMSFSLPPLNRLRIQVEQPTIGVVGLLQQVVRRPAIRRPELVLRIEAGRIQRLASVETRDVLLDRAVVERFLLAARQVDAAP